MLTETNDNSKPFLFFCKLNTKLWVMEHIKCYLNEAKINIENVKSEIKNILFRLLTTAKKKKYKKVKP